MRLDHAPSQYDACAHQRRYAGQGGYRYQPPVRVAEYLNDGPSHEMDRRDKLPVLSAGPIRILPDLLRPLSRDRFPAHPQPDFRPVDGAGFFRSPPDAESHPHPARPRIQPFATDLLPSGHPFSFLLLPKRKLTLFNTCRTMVPGGGLSNRNSAYSFSRCSPPA